MPKPDGSTDSLFACFSIDEDGSEGMMGEVMDGAWQPYVFPGRSILDKILPRVRHLAEISGLTLRVVEFKRVGVIEERRFVGQAPRPKDLNDVHFQN